MVRVVKKKEMMGGGGEGREEGKENYLKLTITLTMVMKRYID